MMKNTGFLATTCVIAIAGVAQAEPIWGIDNGADMLGTFDSATPGTFIGIGTTGITSGFVNSVEFDCDGNLWASDGVSLFSLNTGTGAGTLVGGHGTGDTMTDFSWDGLRMYGISTVCGASSSLWTVDLSTGAATNVCAALLPGACDVGFTFGNGGVMYGHDLVSDSIYTISPTCVTGVHVVLPFDSNFGQGMTAGRTDYHVAFNSTAFAGELWEFDSAGTYSFVGTLGPLQIAGADVGDCLTMSVSALTSGANATWKVANATAGERVAIVYGFSPGRTKVSNVSGYCATFCIRGVRANQLICQKMADGAGDVSCSKMIPASAAGKRVLTQAAERNTCGASHKGECVSNLDDQVVS